MTMLRFNGNLAIEDLRRHPPEIVEKLHQLLKNGARANRDPHRENFYEVENGSHVYFIHVLPTTGKVFLLATWAKDVATATT